MIQLPLLPLDVFSASITSAESTNKLRMWAYEMNLALQEFNDREAEQS